MEVATVKSHIKAKQFDQFYIFTGPEWKVQRIYIDMIGKASEKPVKYVDTFAEVFKSITRGSFISQNYVYVVRDDKDLMNDEKLYSKLSEILKDNILILLCTIVDKRTKFYKTYKDSIVEFEALKSDILKKYIQKEISLNNANCDKLMEVCEYDYGKCLLEIDKMKNFLGGQEEYVTYDDIFNYLLQDGTIYTPPKDAIFDFVDAILDGKIHTMFSLHKECLEVGEATMVMLSVLYNNAKAVLQVQSCQSSDIGKVTGLNGWQIKNAQKHTGVYSSGELVEIMRMCQDMQKNIVTGKIAEEFVIPYILYKIGVM